MGSMGSMPGMPKDETKPDSTTSTNATIEVHFRAMNMRRAGDPAANKVLAFAVLDAIEASPYFDKDSTKLGDDIEEVDEKAESFSFSMKLALRDETKAAKKDTKKKQP